MRIGVIRGDLSGPIFLGDLEPVSQQNPTTEPRGQERYIGRPTILKLETALAHPTKGAGATIEGSDIAANFPITITAANDDLKVKTSSAAAYTTVLVAQAAYANLTLFLAAINVALAGTGVVARQGTGSGQRVALETVAKGVNTYLQIDSTAGGSVANTPLGLGASSVTRTMPSAAAFITALNPVSGTLNVSNTAINGVGSATSANALSLIPTARGLQTALADAIAPKFAETPVVLDSFLYGHIAGYRNSAYNPDKRRVPAVANGAAIAIVADDGSTAYTLTVPTITTAVIASGAITITGTNLGSSEREETVVKVAGNLAKSLPRRRIIAAGGTVSPTSIVIPASLIVGAAATVTKVQVKMRTRATALVTVTT